MLKENRHKKYQEILQFFLLLIMVISLIKYLLFFQNIMDLSRGKRMILLAALNKNTRDFVQQSKRSFLGDSNMNNVDPNNIRDASSDSVSDFEKNESRINSNNFDKIQEKQLCSVAERYVNNSQSSNEDLIFYELQPLRMDLPEPNNGRKLNIIAEATNTEIDVDTNCQQNDIEYTKKGTIRKIQKYNNTLEERKRNKFDLVAQNHNVKLGCDDSCAQKCAKKISIERRNFINAEFWKIIESTERKSFILHHVSKIPVKQRTVRNVDKFRRNQSFQYSLKDHNGTTQIVSKTFFLATLGYDKTNDKVLRTALRSSENSVIVKKDKRSSKEPHNKIDEDPIRTHINSFQPTISHYRREHAPNRLYLSSDLSSIDNRYK